MQKTANWSRCAVPSSAACASADQPPKSGTPFRLSAQMLRIMRLTSFFLLAICLHISAKSSSQTVSLSGKDVPLEKIFNAIKQQTGFVVFYNQGLLSNTKPVTLSVTNMPLYDFLHATLKDQSLDFIINGKTITLSEKISSALNANGTAFVIPPVIPVSGVIRNVNGEPLDGVSIRVKGGSNGTKTNASGRFNLNVNEGDVLTITSLGYLTISIKVNADGTASVASSELQPAGTDGAPGPSASIMVRNHLRDLMIMLSPTATSLNAVTVNKGYYTTSNKLNTGNVSIVTAKDIEKQPVANFLQALQGRVPGLIIIQQSGVPGANFTVQIRGQNSILNGNTPLFIVDGIPYSSDALNQVLAGFTGGTPASNPGSAAGLGGLSPLNNINPADLESIEILKDADATAIYGSRGANGVILITTKKGGAGPLSVSANLNYGTNMPTRLAKFMNTEQYLEMRREALKNDGVQPRPSDYDVLTWDQHKYTDWTKELVGNRSSTVNGQLTVSGGSQQTQYQLGADYSRQNPPYGGNFADNRGTLRFNITNYSMDRRFRMTFAASYSVDYNNLPGMDQYGNIGTPPNAPDLLNPDGSLLWTDNVSNPYASLLRPYKATTQNLMGNLVISYKLMEGLNFRTSAGYTTMRFDEVRQNPSTSMMPTAYNKTQANSAFGNNGGNTWIVEPLLEYEKQISAGNLKVMAGATLQSNVSEGEVITGVFKTDAFLDNITAATTKTITNSYSKYNYAAVFGRISYSYDDKYVVNLTGRRDGSSRFGPGRQFANFGAVGLGWIWSDESFVKYNVPFLSFGKFRASYGVTGSDQVANYKYLDSYTPNSSFTYQNMNGLVPSRLYNSDFGWESNRKLEAAVELGFLKDRINMSASWFKNRSSNQLVTVPLSPAAGSNGVSANLPATVQNTGWEFTFSSTNIRTKAFSWRTNFNLTVARNKLIAFPNLAKSSYANQFVVGEPVTILKLFKYAGVNPQTGLYQFINKEGDLTSSPRFNIDNFIIYHANPDFYGGMQNSFSWKGISVDVFLQYSRQMGKNLIAGWPNPVGTMINVPVIFMNRWQKPGDITNIQRFTQGYTVAATAQSMAANSDQGFSDASYIRCKNVALSYTLDQKWAKKVHMKSARIYAQAQNLFTFTGYEGADPETQGLVLPPMKTMTAGVSFSF